MHLLSIETCFGKFSIALFKNRELIAYFANNEATKQAEELVPAISELLLQNKLTYKDISTIAVCVGPGSFTGLRIGLAAAKGLALALNCELIGVSSLEAALLKYNNQHRPVYLNASRGEAYFQENIESESQLIKYEGDFDEPATAAEVGYVALNKPANHLPVRPLYIRKPDAKLPKDLIMAKIHAKCFDEAWPQTHFTKLGSIIKDDMGFIAYETVIDECTIHTICVLPEHRRKGIAEELMSGLLKVTNVKTFFLEVAQINIAAINLYKKLGFWEYNVRKDYYGAGKDAVMMRYDKS